MKYLKYIVFFISILVLFYFYSCSNEPVIPPNGDPLIQVIDSNIFEWSFVPVPAKIFADNYIADSNAIYFVADEKVFFYDGSNCNLIYTNTDNIDAHRIAGSDKYNVYFGGADRSSGNISYPWLKKWNGVTTQDITMPQDSGINVYDMILTSENDVWMASFLGKIYHFDGSNVTSFQLDKDRTWFPKFFINNNFELMFYFVGRSSINTTEHNVYKYDNNKWVNVYTDLTNDTLFYYFGEPVSVINGMLLRRCVDRIEEFTGTSWKTLVNSPTFQAYSFAGENVNQFLTSGFQESTGYVKMYYLSDNKWLYQSALPLPENIFFGFPIVLSKFNDRYFGFYYPLAYVNHNYILIGKKIIK